MNGRRAWERIRCRLPRVLWYDPHRRAPLHARGRGSVALVLTALADSWSRLASRLPRAPSTRLPAGTAAGSAAHSVGAAASSAASRAGSLVSSLGSGLARLGSTLSRLGSGSASAFTAAASTVAAAPASRSRRIRHRLPDELPSADRRPSRHRRRWPNPLSWVGAAFAWLGSRATGRWRRALLAVWHPRSADARRRRVVVGGAAALSAFVLAVSFPFSTLLSQHRQLSAAAAQLASLRQQNRQLLEQQKQLSSKTEIERRARQDYQLVQPGQTLLDILPGPESAGGGTTEGRSSLAYTGVSSPSEAGDPGLQPLVDPSKAPDLAPDPGLPSAPPASALASASASAASGRSGVRGTTSDGPTDAQPPSSFWSRVTDTLEFWR